MYLLAQQQAKAGRIADTSQRNLGFQQGFVQYGQRPDFDALGLDLDPADYGFDDQFGRLVDQSNQSGVSVLSQLQRARDAARNGQINNLAARGMLQSGETQHQLGRVEQEATLAQHEAQQEFVEYLMGLSQAFAEGERGRSEGLANSAQEAYEHQLSLPQNRPTGSTQAGLIKGAGWYRGVDGRLYGQNANEIDKPAARRRTRRRLREMKSEGVSLRKRRRSVAYRRNRLAGGGQ